MHFPCQDFFMAIVFYDGDCGLCQRSIHYLANADAKKKLRFAPLNGVTYKKIYGEELVELTTVKVFSHERTFEKSAAVFELCRELGGFHRAFLIFKLIPKKILNFLYDEIASRRKSFSCMILTRDERFLL